MTSIHHGVTKQTDVICEDVTPATQTILPAPISTVFSLAGIRGNVIAKANPQFVTVSLFVMLILRSKICKPELISTSQIITEEINAGQRRALNMPSVLTHFFIKSFFVLFIKSLLSLTYQSEI